MTQRLLALVALLAIGVIAGFLIRLLWPRRTTAFPTSYRAPVPRR
mgnify:CR=1 FL=1